MATNGRIPSFASPPAKVTACSSDMPTSKTRPGIASFTILMEVPESIPAVIPTILLFECASSSKVSPKTSWNFGGLFPSAGVQTCSPVTGLNFPGACQMAGFCSAASKPFPFIVLICKILGPVISFMSRSTLTIADTSCPSIGPK